MMDDAKAAADRNNWLQTALGSPVVEHVPLLGGLSSVVERCRLHDGRVIVVREITDQEWLKREPYLIASEAAALEIMAGAAMQVPEHLASDPELGRLAMSWLPGSLRVDAADQRRSIDALGRACASIASAELPAGHPFRSWRPWVPSELEPPAWGDRHLWRDAIDRWHATAPPTSDETVLLHRDLHMLNVLWHEDEPAVIDWVNACVGHPHAEYGHTRFNLAVTAGLDVADAFLDSVMAQAPDVGPYDPWWDLVDLLGFLPGPIGTEAWQTTGRPDLTSTVVVERTEAFLRDVLMR